MKYLYILFSLFPFIISGQIDQVKEYYSNGNLAIEKNYIYDKLNGYFKSFYENGEVESEGYYKNNLKKGFWKYYYKDGQVRYKKNYKYGKLRGYFMSFYSNGQVEEEGNYIDVQEKNGLWKSYYENGQLKSEEFYKDKFLVSAKYFDLNGEGPSPSNKSVTKYNPLHRPLSW